MLVRLLVSPLTDIEFVSVSAKASIFTLLQLILSYSDKLGLWVSSPELQPLNIVLRHSRHLLYRIETGRVYHRLLRT